MKILLAGPIETASLAAVLGDTSGLPPGTAPTPVNVLAVEYVHKGHHVCLVTLDPTVPERVCVSRPGIDVVYLPRRMRARDVAFSLFEQEIQALQREYEAARPDIIHAHWTYEFAEAGVRAKAPLLVSSHDSAWETAWIEGDVYRFFRLLMALRTVPRIRNMTVVAPYLAPHMRWSGYFGKINVVPNGLDLAEWRYQQRRIPADNPVITAIGNGLPRKNIRVAIAAFSFIRAQRPEAELHLFGPGLDSYGNVKGVFIHGAVPNRTLRKFHQDRTTILLHPSRQEICPVSIIEARALGIPVVAGIRSGGVPYVMGGGNPGLVDIRNANEISRVVLNILSDAEMYDHLSMTGRADVERRFDIRFVAKQYIALYQSIAAKV